MKKYFIKNLREINDLSRDAKSVLALILFVLMSATIFAAGGLNYILFERAEISRQYLTEEIRKITISETDRMIKACYENK